MNFKENKVLKPVTIVTLLYSAFIFIKYFGILSGIFFESSNPLIPKYLPYFAAFPSFIIVPFFTIIIIACLKTFKLNRHDYRVVYALFILALSFFIFQSLIFEFLMYINPYSS
jgi:hypothetical protein